MPFYLCLLNKKKDSVSNPSEVLCLASMLWYKTHMALPVKEINKTFNVLYSFHILLIHRKICAHFICWDTFVYSCQYIFYIYYVCMKCSYIYFSSTESDLNIRIGKAETAMDRLLTIWKSDLSEIFQAVAISVLLYSCTSWTLTKCLEKSKMGNLQGCYMLF